MPVPATSCATDADESDGAVLRRGVGRHVRDSPAGRLIDDTTISRPHSRPLHLAQTGAQGEERAGEVDGQHLVPQVERRCAPSGALAATPALATTTSTGPASANSASTDASSVTSATIARTPGVDAATASSGSRRRPHTTTSAPAAAKLRARSAPSPVPPPVMSTPPAVEPHARIASWARSASRFAWSRPGRYGSGHAHVGVAELDRRVQRPVRVGEVRAGEADEVGAARPSGSS